MVTLREYVLSVSAAAVICGILSGILGEKTFSGAAVKMLCGIVMLIAVLNPFVKIKWDDILCVTDSFQNAGALVAEEGIDYGRQALEHRIKERTAAYIQEKARQYRASLEVEVDVAGENIPVPESVRLIGTVSPYARRQLQRDITLELGIPEERQIWIN